MRKALGGLFSILVLLAFLRRCFYGALLVSGAVSEPHRIADEPAMQALQGNWTAAGAATAPPPQDDPKEDPRDWKTESSDGAVVVTQRSAGEKNCVLEAKRGERVLWTGKQCAGTKLDFKFVSPDGERLAIIYPLPTIEGSVRSSTVMRMFKHGAQQYASAAAATTKDWSKLRTGGTNFYWLAGSVGASGEAPHYADDGRAFEFSTVDGRSHHVTLNE